MSKSSGSGIPSNEEVIDELTKDLKSSAIRDDTCDDDGTSHQSESEPETDAHDNEEIEIREKDYIDDNLLKERDDKLSEEEKRVSVTIYNLPNLYLLVPINNVIIILPL